MSEDALRAGTCYPLGALFLLLGAAAASSLVRIVQQAGACGPWTRQKKLHVLVLLVVLCALPSSPPSRRRAR
jgi:hypothetical protein